MVTRNGQFLSKETVSDLLTVILLDCQKQLPELTEKSRIARRKVLGDREQYLNQLQLFTEDFNKFVAKITEDNCSKSHVTTNEYMESFEEQVKQGNQDILLLQSSISQLMKCSSFLDSS